MKIQQIVDYFLQIMATTSWTMASPQAPLHSNHILLWARIPLSHANSSLLQSKPAQRRKQHGDQGNTTARTAVASPGAPGGYSAFSFIGVVMIIVSIVWCRPGIANTPLIGDGPLAPPAAATTGQAYAVPACTCCVQGSCYTVSGSSMLLPHDHTRVLALLEDTDLIAQQQSRWPYELLLVCVAVGLQLKLGGRSTLPRVRLFLKVHFRDAVRGAKSTVRTTTTVVRHTAVQPHARHSW